MKTFGYLKTYLRRKNMTVEKLKKQMEKSNKEISKNTKVKKYDT